VGINLEDFGRDVARLYTISEAQERIRRVLRVAREEGVPEFVVNARTDALSVGKPVDEAIERGIAYLTAGAANVFIWGGSSRKGWSREDVKKACGELGGMLNVILVRTRSDGLSVEELRKIGVSRISVGPQLMLRTVEGVTNEAKSIHAGEGV
jgi:2-methylisocitrate lyase-like PEP mutase family enzyme